MKKFIVFNWKMNPASYSEAERLARASLTLAKGAKNYEVVICPPMPWVDNLAGKFGKKIKLGAQDVFWKEEGAYTGEVSPVMLKKSGVQYVIVGHSERRQNLGETDQMVNKKLLAALGDGLTAILCVGEHLAVRRRGLKAAKNFLKNQIQKDIPRKSAFSPRKSALVVAYEPIWAIGTGMPCEPKDALAVTKFIKDFLISHYSLLNTRVLYGGSVTGKNIIDFIQYKEIDGALVGGASLKPEQFRKVIN